MVLRSWRPFLLLLLLLAGKLTKPQVSWQTHQGAESSSGRKTLSKKVSSKWLDRDISSQGR